MSLTRVLSLGLGLVAAALCGAASAGDGVVLIDQACALGPGCLPGDVPGFPVTIATAGSYRLASSLDVRGAAAPGDTTAILVSVARVDLDLNGFSILGPVTCTGSGAGLVCSGTGTGVGVDAAVGNARVRDGQIEGMGSDGVRGGASRFEDLSVRSCGGDGVECIEACRIARVLAHANGGRGIAAGPRSQVSGSAAHANLAAGLEAGDGAELLYNVSRGNGGAGIIGGVIQLVGNVVRANGAGGVSLPTAASLTHNVITGNTGGWAVTGGLPLLSLTQNSCESFGFIGCLD